MRKKHLNGERKTLKIKRAPINKTRPDPEQGQQGDLVDVKWRWRQRRGSKAVVTTKKKSYEQ